MGLATIGTFILWLGWFGFNPGSTMAADPGAIAHIALTTNMAAAAGALAATITAWLLLGKPDFSMILNGSLAGLVAITAGCNVVSVGSSIVIGLIAGVLVVYAVLFFDKVKLDDPVGALSVHLVSGVFGTLASALFATDGGLFFGGGVAKLVTQLIGIAAVGAFVFVASAVAWFAAQGHHRHPRQRQRRDRRPRHRRARHGGLPRLRPGRSRCARDRLTSGSRDDDSSRQRSASRISGAVLPRGVGGAARVGGWLVAAWRRRSCVASAPGRFDQCAMLGRSPAARRTGDP